MITIQKLPTLEPEMRGALRSHIMLKRQRLRQELEQDAIMKRMRKEREQKRIQDAMTLDQIKEQLSTLEKKLEALRSEKHDLFVQLKQVLNEGSSKRKTGEIVENSKIASSEQKKPRLEDSSQNEIKKSTYLASQMMPESNLEQSSTALNQNQTQPTSIQLKLGHERSTNEKLHQKPIPARQNLAQLAALQQRDLSPRNPSTVRSPMSCQDNRSSLFTNTSPNYSKTILNQPHMNPTPQDRTFVNQQSSTKLTNQLKVDPLTQSSSTGFMNSPNFAALQSQFSGPLEIVALDNGKLPSHVPTELLTSNIFDSNYQKLVPPLKSSRLSLHSMSMDIPPSVSQHAQPHQQFNTKLLGQYHVPKSIHLNSFGKPRLPQFDDQLMFPKRESRNLGAYHQNQVMVDGSMPASLTQLRLLNQAAFASNMDQVTQLGQPVVNLGLKPEFNQHINFNPRKPLSNHNIPLSSADIMSSHLRPDILLPSLNQLYPPHPAQSLMPVNSIYDSETQLDMKHMNALYHSAAMSHQLGNGSLANFNSPLAQQSPQHQEHASRKFSNQNSTNYHRRPGPKHSFR